MPVEGLKSVRVDFGGGRGDTVRVFKELLTDSLVVGETVWAVDDDGTERLAWVSAERGETYVLRVYPASDGEKVGEVSFVVHSVDANLQPLRFE